MSLQDGCMIFTKTPEEASYNADGCYVILNVVFDLTPIALVVASPLRAHNEEPRFLFLVNYHKHHDYYFSDQRAMTPLEQVVYLNGPSEALVAL